MRICALAGLIVMGASTSIAQGFWSTPIPITWGSYDNLHPRIADGEGWMPSGREDLLAFSRNGKNICVLQTTNNGTAWQTDPYYVTTDSADNDFPSLVHTSAFQQANDTVMLVWQTRKNGNLDIYYSMYDQVQWSVPQPISTDPADDIRPHIGFSTGRFYVTWERNGTIMFSQFDGVSWSPAQRVSSNGDTLNHFPQVIGYYLSGSHQPLIVWEKKRVTDTTSVLMSAYRSGSTWTSPDTLMATGDNRRPRFFKYTYNHSTSLQWDRMVPLSSVSYSGSVSVSGGSVVLGTVEPLFTVSSRNASVNGFLIITLPDAIQFAWYSVAAFESQTDSVDSIGVSAVPFVSAENLGAPAALSNRNPDVSQGIVTTPGFSVRFWVVWEALVGGKWQLYGSNIVVHIDDVYEAGLLPRRPELSQNYPNPFNPTTTISFQLPSKSFVMLKIFDLLGREVSSLVSEELPAGNHLRQWNAEGLASGVYLYRLQAGSFNQTKKLVLMK